MIGKFRQVNVFPENAGNFSAALPIQSVPFKLHAIFWSAQFSNVGSRYVQLKITYANVTEIFWSWAPSIDATVFSSAQICWSQSNSNFNEGPYVNPVNMVASVPLPVGLVLDSKAQVTVFMDGSDPGDILGVVSYLLEDLFDDPTIEVDLKPV